MDIMKDSLLNGKKLGRGFRGSVFLCHHVLDQVFLGEYAIKKVAVGNNHQWLVRMLKEVMLLEKLRNPNIIEYKHAWLEEHRFSLFGPKVPCLFILMERANGGNLEEYVQLQWNPEEQFEKTLSVKERIKRKRLQMKAAQNQIRDNRAQFFGGIGYDSFGKRVRYLTTEAIWKIFLDICYGLNHLHDLGIIHRDLKPPNLLLQYNDPNNQEEIPKVLISDFGECEILSHIEKRQRTGATGTLEFMAPELLMSDETGHYYDDYSSNSDLWSLGVVLYYICFSEMPYSQVDDIDILKNEILNYSTVHFKNDNNSNRVPKELKSLIKKLMVKEPTKRPKAKEILKLYGGYVNKNRY
jgi:serine/threonine protein kinase